MNNGYTGQPRPQYYRAVFLSDFHIGAKSFDAKAATDFLKSCYCDKIYLVGDIIDGWKLNKRWFWTEDCSRLLDELVRKIDLGTRIIYLPGNHDEEVRRILPILRRRFAKKIGIEIRDKAVHHMFDGRKLLVLHGDQFDRKILKGPLSRWSDELYDGLLEFVGAHRRGPKIKIGGVMKPFSLAKSLSKHGQKALHTLNNFENAVYKMVQNKGLDGLICGHTHIPVIKPIKDITYANSGSWLRSGHTALVETENGALELIDWPSTFDPPLLSDQLFKTQCRLSPSAERYRPITHKIIRAIRKVWPEKGIKRVKAVKSETAHTAIRHFVKLPEMPATIKKHASASIANPDIRLITANVHKNVEIIAKTELQT